MNRGICILAIAMSITACKSFNPEAIADATNDEVSRVEPLSWWTGMKMPLQLMVTGKGVSQYDVRIEGGKGVKVRSVEKADSPDYLFVDVDIAKNAASGTCFLVFSKADKEFKYPYVISDRAPGSADRKSFTNADMVYLVFPDRFANGDPTNDSTDDTFEKADRNLNLGRHGGDIQGIMDHLDYISELGATAIWSTPLLLDDQKDESYHGYACGDYYKIDPRFGTNEMYRAFVEKAHSKRLKVIMDVVTNHCGTEHWWMHNLPFEDWVHVFPEYTPTNIAFSTNMDPNASSYDRNIQESGWFVPSMPDMNLDNPFVLRYFQQWAIWWLEYAGVDGFRVDTYPYNEKEPMSEWCKAVRNEFPNINIVGECWTSSYPQLAYWQGDNENKDGFNSNLPSIMDFPLWEAMTAAICEGGDNPQWGQGMTRVYDCLSHDFVYHDLSKMLIFFANHDHSRMGDVFAHDPAKMKIALALLATLRGMPQLYNGDEMMFSCKPGDWSDGAKRIDFPGGWAGDKVNLFTAEGRAAAGKTEEADYSSAAMLHDYTARLFNWRKTKEVIHSGRTKHFITRDNTYAFFRYNEEDKVFVFVNNSAHDVIVPWRHYSEIVTGSLEAYDVISGKDIVLSENTVVPAFTVLVADATKSSPSASY